MMVIGKRIKDMEGVYILKQMAINMMGIGEMIKDMVKE